MTTLQSPLVVEANPLWAHLRLELRLMRKQLCVAGIFALSAVVISLISDSMASLPLITIAPTMALVAVFQSERTQAIYGTVPATRPTTVTARYLIALALNLLSSAPFAAFMMHNPTETVAGGTLLAMGTLLIAMALTLALFHRFGATVATGVMLWCLMFLGGVLTVVVDSAATPAVAASLNMTTVGATCFGIGLVAMGISWAVSRRVYPRRDL